MTKALILARNQHHYMNVMRQLQLNPNEYRYVRGEGISEIRGYWVDMPVILIQEYEGNCNYDLELMNYIGHRFDNIGYVTEREIWDESIIV